MKTHKFDSVLTYHRNIHTCGVARFNHYLALELSIPIISFTDAGGQKTQNPIVSIKFSEISSHDLPVVYKRLQELAKYSLILHDHPDAVAHQEIINRAERVMGLNNEITETLKLLRSDAVTGFTVSSYEMPEFCEPPELRLITFGMAHKIQSNEYRRIARLLESDSRSHVLEISCALHEGTQFDDSFFEVGDEISEFFAGRVRFLGFLADSEVSLRVARASAMLAFFPKGARENNNSVMSAMALGCPVITNLDGRSPSWMQHEVNVFDVSRLARFPSSTELERVGSAGRASVGEFSYERLLQVLTEGHE